MADPLNRERPYISYLFLGPERISERDFIVKTVKQIRDLFHINKAAYDIFFDKLNKRQHGYPEQKEDEECFNILRKYNLVNERGEVHAHLPWRVILPAKQALLFEREDSLNDEGEYWMISTKRLNDLILERGFPNSILV